MQDHTTKVTVDRIEGGQAVLELPSGGTLTCPLDLLPDRVKEGDALDITFSRDPDERERREKSVRDMQEKLRSRNE